MRLFIWKTFWWECLYGTFWWDCLYGTVSLLVSWDCLYGQSHFETVISKWFQLSSLTKMFIWTVHQNFHINKLIKMINNLIKMVPDKQTKMFIWKSHQSGLMRQFIWNILMRLFIWTVILMRQFIWKQFDITVYKQNHFAWECLYKQSRQNASI